MILKYTRIKNSTLNICTRDWFLKIFYVQSSAMTAIICMGDLLATNAKEIKSLQILGIVSVLKEKIILFLRKNIIYVNKVNLKYFN